MKKQTYQEESLTKKQSYLFFIIVCIIGMLMSSCSHSLSVYDAAKGKARCGMFIK